MKRGDVYFASLGYKTGSEQGGYRPVVIIQNDKGNTFSPTVLVACVTKRNKRNLPTHVKLPKRLEFDCDSTVMAEQIKTIDKTKLEEFVCHLPEEYMEKIDDSLKISFGIKEKEKKDMEQLQIFKNVEFGEIRTLTINGEPWLVGKDVAVALGYTNPQKAIRDHVDVEDKTLNELFTVNGTQGILINESGFYSLVLSSKLPSAKKFKRWVTSEVLPAIRKTGSYQLSANPLEQIKIIAGGVLQMDERLTKLENTMTIDYAQQQSITKAVNKAVTKVLGGKGSNAYHEVGKKVFAECNRDIKDFFCVNARNNIPKAKFQNAMEYIEKWTPSTNTKLLINECNAQMCLQ